MSGPGMVLVVDDDDDIRDVVVLLLGEVGYRAIGARGGREALESIRTRGPPDLVLLDLRMPEMSGPDFVRALRGAGAAASVPVVVLSGDAHAADIAVGLGAAGCLVKPVELDVLMGTVRRFVPARGKPASPESE